MFKKTLYLIYFREQIRFKIKFKPQIIEQIGVLF